MLHALGEGVVRALCDREAIDQLNGLATIGLDWLVKVGDEELAPRDDVGELLEAERAEAPGSK